MSAKPAHKLAGRELLAADLSLVTDSIGRVIRVTKAYSGYSTAEKARIDAANEGAGGTAPGKRRSNGS